jgi:hypothetical protein
MTKLLLLVMGGGFLVGCSSLQLTDTVKKYGYRQVSVECGPITENKATVLKATRYSACDSGNGSEKGKNAIPCSQDENAFIAKVIPSPSCPVNTQVK